MFSLSHNTLPLSLTCMELRLRPTQADLRVLIHKCFCVAGTSAHRSCSKLCYLNYLIYNLLQSHETEGYYHHHSHFPDKAVEAEVGFTPKTAGAGPLCRANL